MLYFFQANNIQQDYPLPPFILAKRSLSARRLTQGFSKWIVSNNLAIIATTSMFVFKKVYLSFIIWALNALTSARVSEEEDLCRQECWKRIVLLFIMTSDLCSRLILWSFLSRTWYRFCRVVPDTPLHSFPSFVTRRFSFTRECHTFHDSSSYQVQWISIYHHLNSILRTPMIEETPFWSDPMITFKITTVSFTDHNKSIIGMIIDCGIDDLCSQHDLQLW